jgi:ribosomal subunit interface protein
MEIRITGKNTEVTEEIKEWVLRKASKLERYAPRLVEAHAILKREKHFYVAELTLLARHLRAYGEGRHKENLLTAIDMACDRVATQLKKFREKVKSHSLNQDRRRLSREAEGPTG